MDMNEKPNKAYKVHIVEVDPETGTEVAQVLDEQFAGMLICADCGDGRLCEVLLNDRIVDLAARLASGEKTAQAARLAVTIMKLKKRLESVDLEDELLNAIMGDE